MSGDWGDPYGMNRYGGRESTVMTIGVLGTGGIAVTLATMFAQAGHEVRLDPGTPGPAGVADLGATGDVSGVSGRGGEGEAMATGAGGVIVPGGRCEEVAAAEGGVMVAREGVAMAAGAAGPARAG
ncbi:hypothetical protein ACFWJM_09980 [Streptomyces sp. NPDC127077]|uniref:hypothetical protein n=1 Tax=Streptomyces sp. NPDC127077 TaxID=3347131 RepID=UPI00364D0820